MFVCRKDNEPLEELINKIETIFREAGTSIDDIGRMHRIDEIVETFLDEADDSISLTLRESLNRLSYAKAEKLYNQLIKQ